MTFEPKSKNEKTLIEEFIEAVECPKTVAGLTHNFYRYPARFSPQFARAALKLFTKPGDVVLDPFMGGGTSLVEAYALGRRAVGLDVSHLAFFVSKVKTTLMSETDFAAIQNWFRELLPKTNLHEPAIRANAWIEKGYQRNISGKSTWPIRKMIELALYRLDELSRQKQRNFARCVILKTSQWALDCRLRIPTAVEFRGQLLKNLESMRKGTAELKQEVGESSKLHSVEAMCLRRSAKGIQTDPRLTKTPPPNVVITSPPYPGVHVLYHRWQIQGRRETPAPFWIANGLDGKPASFYTFGDRGQDQLKGYFQQLLAVYSSIAMITAPDALIIQLVAFNDPSWQLPKYLEVMQNAGFAEEKLTIPKHSRDGRLWRNIPHRKWYAEKKGNIHSSKEVVLFHRRTRH